MADVLVSTLSEAGKAHALRRLARLRRRQIASGTAPRRVMPSWPGERPTEPPVAGGLHCGHPIAAIVVDEAGVEVCSACAEGL